MLPRGNSAKTRIYTEGYDFWRLSDAKSGCLRIWSKAGTTDRVVATWQQLSGASKKKGK